MKDSIGKGFALFNMSFIKVKGQKGLNIGLILKEFSA
jgi:hypothetical protein